MQLQQVNFTYNSNEDRILMRIVAGNNDEIRIWLTRKSLVNFITQAQNWVNAVDGNSAGSPESAYKSLRREQAAVSADTSQPFRAGNKFPLGENPQLAVALVIESDNNGSQIIIDLVNTQRLTLNLAESALAGIQRVLQETINITNWNFNSSHSLNKVSHVTSPSLTKH